MNKERFQRMKANYLYYRQSLHPFYDKIKQNNKWYKQEQDEFESSGNNPSIPLSRTGHLFNAIQFKHADLMDNYPHVNVLPREPQDEEEANKLGSIIPYILENTKFKRCYSYNSYEKLKNGCCCYGVFFNPGLNNGLGDIDIKAIDLTKFAWQPNITDLQSSKYIFYDSFMDIEEFYELYGKRENIKTQATYDEVNDKAYSTFINDNVVITDCYYKKRYKNGKVVLHFAKFSGEELLLETEGKEEYQNGIYDHGQYPFMMDVLHPVSEDITGLGVIDIAKNPQAYIDKLDDIINANALLAGKPRFFIKDNGGVNENEFLDCNNTLIHVAGNVSDENISQIIPQPLPAFIAQHRAEKVQELKEIVGNRDFNQGGLNGGVTAASAITALQNSGDKLVRDMLSSSYEVLCELMGLVIELVRQFYDDTRTFRIIGEDNKSGYLQYDNRKIKDVDVYGLSKPLFDISLTVEKNNPFSRQQHNDLMLSLNKMGLFEPSHLDIGILVLSNLHFDGKEKVLKQLKKMQEDNGEKSFVS